MSDVEMLMMVLSVYINPNLKREMKTTINQDLAYSIRIRIFSFNYIIMLVSSLLSVISWVFVFNYIIMLVSSLLSVISLISIILMFDLQMIIFTDSHFISIICLDNHICHCVICEL